MTLAGKLRTVGFGLAASAAACGGGDGATPPPPPAAAFRIDSVRVSAVDFQGAPATVEVFHTATNCTPTVSVTYGAQSGSSPLSVVRQRGLAGSVSGTCGGINDSRLFTVPVHAEVVIHGFALSGLEGDTLRRSLSDIVQGGAYQSLELTSSNPQIGARVVGGQLLIEPAARAVNGSTTLRIVVIAGTDRKEGNSTAALTPS